MDIKVLCDKDIISLVCVTTQLREKHDQTFFNIMEMRFPVKIFLIYLGENILFI